MRIALGEFKQESNAFAVTAMTLAASEPVTSGATRA
jgi:hypothetical protein